MLVLTHKRIIRDVLFKLKGEEIDESLLKMIKKFHMEENATINLFFDKESLYEYFLDCDNLQKLYKKTCSFIENLKPFCHTETSFKEPNSLEGIEVNEDKHCLPISVGKSKLKIEFCILDKDEHKDFKDIKISMSDVLIDDSKNKAEINELSLLYLLDYITPKEIFNIATEGCVYNSKDGYAVLNIETGHIETVSLDKDRAHDLSEQNYVEIYKISHNDLSKLDSLYFDFKNEEFESCIEKAKEQVKQKMLKLS
ncbi:MAG: hypothetical protein XD41_0586 [Desulfonauticus sp. 38_4375]|nr:MAG: hypothetical protein XD41_0586 [Desulfonauticus sp. 38_4375]